MKDNMSYVSLCLLVGIVMDLNEQTQQQQQNNRFEQQDAVQAIYDNFGYGYADGRQLMVSRRVTDEQVDDFLINRIIEEEPDQFEENADEPDIPDNGLNIIIDDQDEGYESDTNKPTTLELSFIDEEEYFQYWTDVVQLFDLGRCCFNIDHIANLILSKLLEKCANTQNIFVELKVSKLELYKKFLEIYGLVEEIVYSQFGEPLIRFKIRGDLNNIHESVVYSLTIDYEDANLVSDHILIKKSDPWPHMEPLTTSYLNNYIKEIKKEFADSVAIAIPVCGTHYLTHFISTRFTNNHIYFRFNSYERLYRYIYNGNRFDPHRDFDVDFSEIHLDYVTLSDLELISRSVSGRSSRNEQNDGRFYMEPQSESPDMIGDQDGETTKVSSTHVELLESRGTELAIPAQVLPATIREFGFTPAPGIFSDFTDRFNNLGTFNWSISDKVGSIIKEIDLPIDILRTLLANPATLPLLQYQFWRPQIEVNFQLTSTQFHAGLLVIGLKYYSKTDALTPGLRTPKYAEQLWSLDYGVMRASGSSNVLIKVPYQSHLDVIPIRDGVVGSSSYYASIYVGVASPLNIKEGNETVTITIQARLSCDGTQTMLFGQTTRKDLISDARLYLEPQSLLGILGVVMNIGKIVGVVGTGVSTIINGVIKPIESLFGGSGAKKENKTTNEDKPMVPLEAGPVTYYPSVSMSWGSGPTFGRSLRLNPTNLTPHLESTVPSNTSMLDNSIAQRWGYLGKFSVSVSDPINKELYSTEISPMCCATVPGVGKATKLPTPCSGIAGMYTYWSGSIRYKFIVAKANPQSLRLRIISTPINVSTTEFVDCYSTVIDFNENTEVEYEAPYFAPTKLTPITQGSNFVNLGFIKVRLESVFTNISICPETIDVIVLQSASPSLKFSVPRPVVWRPGGETPEPGVPSIKWLIAQADEVQFGYIPYSSGDFSSLSNGSIQQVASIDKNFYCTSRVNTEMLRFLKSKVESDFGKDAYFCIINDGDDRTRTVITQYAFDAHIERLYDLGSQFRPVSCTVFYRNDQWTDPITHDMGIDVQVVDQGSIIRWSVQFVPWPTKETQEERLFLQPQNGEATSHDREAGEPAINPTESHESVILGEEFQLIEMMKRYQPVLHIEQNFKEVGHYELAWDVNYGTLVSRVEGGQISNLAWCHDSFRFGKGGINYNIVIDNCSDANIKMKIYHLPGGDPRSVILNPTFEKVDTTEITNNAYAHEVVATVGTSVPVHVPYYNYTNYLVNGYDPAVRGVASLSAYSFGQMILAIDILQETNLSLTIHRSLGDDGQLYTFQGWPLCVNSTPVYTNYSETTPLTSRSLPDTRIQFTPQCSETLINSYFITHFGDCRRGRKVLDRYFKKISGSYFMIPQSGRSTTEAEKLAINTFLLELVRIYESGGVLQGPLPLIVESQLLDSDIRMLREEVSAEDVLFRKSILADIACRLHTEFDGLSNEFFAHTKLGSPKRTWLKTISSLSSRVSSAVPNAVKAQLLNIDESLFNIPSKTGGVLATMLKLVGEGIMTASNIFLLITSLQMMMSASEIWVKAMAFTNVLAMFGLVTPRQMGLVFVIANMVKSVSRKAGYVYMEPQDCCRSDITAYISALMGGAAALAGFSSAKTWTAGIESFVKLWASVSNSWSTLLTKSCTFIIDYILYLFGADNPASAAVTELKNLNLDVTVWANRVLELTNPSRHDEVISDVNLRTEVAQLYEQGAIFIKVITEDKERPAQVTSFLTLWKRLSDLYNETGETPDSIKANTTPISIWIHGDPGVGKSECAKTLAVKLAALLGITYSGDPYFVRTPRKYWDGYAGQPILIFDDALQVTAPELHSVFVQDWFSIMTNAPYSPEFASITEKKKFVTPRLVIVCSNQSHPRPAGVSSPEAFNRRRDFLLHAQINPDLRKRYPDLKNLNDLRLDSSDFEDFNHIRFAQYSDVLEPSIGTNGCYTMNQLIQTLAPKIADLEVRRRKAAENQVKASNCLRPENIAQFREELEQELLLTSNVTQLGKEVVNKMVETLQPQDDEIHKPESPFIFKQEDEGLVCVNSCDMVTSYQCFCTLSPRQISTAQYCMTCGIFTVEQVLNCAALGECSDCTSLEKNRCFDSLIKKVQKDLDDLPGGHLVKLPELRNKITKLSFKKIDLTELNKWLTDRAKSFWQQLPLRYLVPLAITFGLHFVLKFYLSLDLVKQAFSYITGSQPEQRQSQGTYEKAVRKLEAKTGMSLEAFTNAYGKSGDRSYNFTDAEHGDRIGPWVYNKESDSWTKDAAWLGMAQLASSGSVTTRGIPNRIFRATKAQDSSQSQLVDRVYRNRIKITVYYSSGKIFTSWGLGIRNRQIVLPYHTFVKIDEPILGIEIQMSNYQGEKGGSVMVAPDGYSIKRIAEYDLCIMNVTDKRIPQFRNISRAFVKERELSKVSRKGLLLDVLGDDINRAKVNLLDVAHTTAPGAYKFDSKDFYFDFIGFSYPLEGVGMCGSILLDRTHGLITGMHTSGGNGLGYASLLCEDVIEKYLEKENIVDVEEVKFEGKGSVQPKGEFVPLGKLLDAQCVRLPMKSSIAKSACFGLLTKPVRAPVKFIEPGEPRPGITRLTRAVEKGGSPPLPWPKEDVKLAVDDLTRMILANAKPVTVECRRRTVEEAIVGVPGVPFMDALKRSTSVGWPLNVSGFGTKKDNYIQYEEDAEGLHVVGLHPEFANLYEKNHALRLKGVIPFSPYCNFLKDERLKPGKLPRLINGGPLDQTLETRRYLMDFVAALQLNGRNKNIGVGVGINVHGLEWSQLANDLLSVGDSIACGDYSGFGPGLDPNLVIACKDIVNAWYRQYQTCDRDSLDQDDIVRETLFENLAFSHEINVDTVLQTLCGSPSGAAITCIVNSLVNLLYFRLIWLEVFRGTFLEDFAYFRKLLQIFVYGDDVILSIHTSILDCFNNQIVSEVLAKRGIKYTDADKSGNIRLFCDISEATFLKCHFVPHPVRGRSFWLAALEKPMIEDIPNWVRTPYGDLDEVSLENCKEACRLAYAWGFDYFNQIRKKLEEYWFDRGFTFEIESWQYLDAMFFGELRDVGVPKEFLPCISWA